MSRLRQISPQNYRSSASVHTEFESVIRYLNAAELGNKTISELFKVLFDNEGNFIGPIELRRDSSAGIEYRVGTYDSEDKGWINLVELSEIRGEPGLNVGEIGAPLLYAREDYEPAAAETSLDYAFLATDALLVFEDGILLQEGALNDYELNLMGGSGTGSVDFTSAFSGTENVSIFKVRSELVSGYNRVDYNTVALQTTFTFVHDDTSKLLVFLNGILQREGGGFDYTTDSAANTVTFLNPVPASSLVSIMTVENALTTAVSGLMLEEQFTDLTTGLIKFSKIGVGDEEIPQAKVFGLVDAIGTSAKLTVSAGTPADPVTGDLWLDITASPNELKFFDGTQWLQTTPVSAIPAFAPTDGLKVLRVNGTGTGLEYSTVDLSSVIPLSQKGAASGVASLDGNAKLPTSQLPDGISRISLSRVIDGAIANDTYTVQRIWKERIEVDAIALRLSGGTATARLAINGVGVGSTFAISTTPTEVILGQGGNPDIPQDVDATSASKTIDVIITGAAGASILDIAVGASVTL